MSLNVEEPYKEEEVLYQVQVRLNSRGRERVLKVKVYNCAPPLYIHSWFCILVSWIKSCFKTGPTAYSILEFCVLSDFAAGHGVIVMNTNLK